MWREGNGLSGLGGREDVTSRGESSEGRRREREKGRRRTAEAARQQTVAGGWRKD